MDWENSELVAGRYGVVRFSGGWPQQDGTVRHDLWNLYCLVGEVPMLMEAEVARPRGQAVERAKVWASLDH